MILALETSTTASSAAVFTADGEAVAERLDLEGPAHAQRLLPFVHEVLTTAGLTVADVDTVVCGLGPGAYTGMRIGVATARALTQATGARLAGVPTLVAVALAVGETAPAGAPLVALLDGKRHEVFAACYRKAGDELFEVAPLAVVPAAALPDYLSQWPGAYAGGDGAVVYEELLTEPPAAGARGAAASVSLSPATFLTAPTVTLSPVAAPTAAMVARAWFAGVPGSRQGFDEVLPLYGRDPDAAKWTARPA